jgi:glycosyltransferase involved in cell wall biosynthesis
MPYLVEAIRSLLQQTFQDFIVLAIDNGSTDGTKEYLNGIRNEKIRYIRIEVTSLVKALNTGLDLADTPFIARMDADDISHPARFEKQIAFLNQNRDIGLVGCNGRYINAVGNRYFDWNVPLHHEEIIKTMMRKQNAIAHPSILFRAEAIKPYGGYDGRYFPCEDYELFLRIGDKIRLANLPERLHQWRVREGSVMAERVKESIRMYHFVANQYAPKYQKKGSFREAPPKADKATFLEKLDIASMTIYRRGLGYYLNVNPAIGASYFLLAALVNPSRCLHTLKRRAKSLGRAVPRAIL